jgi:hypothetical protein
MTITVCIPGLLPEVEQPRILPWVAVIADGLRPNAPLSSRLTREGPLNLDLASFAWPVC